MKGKEQIVIGLVVVNDIPIHQEVRLENTVNTKMLLSKILVLRKRFYLKRMISVGETAFRRGKSIELLDQKSTLPHHTTWIGRIVGSA
jgi:hypothetical protein